MNNLTVDQIFEVHQSIMERSDGDQRLLSEANLHQMVFRVNGIHDPLRKAATAVFLLVAYPPFLDGNKRTAKEILEIILAQNGYNLLYDDDSIRNLIQGVVTFTVEEDDIERWLLNRTRKVNC